MQNPTESTATLTGVSETLMITLYARYAETQRPDAILRDPKAVEIVEQVDYDFSKYTKGWASQLGCVLRAELYDRLTNQFLQTHPQALVINLGAGLCTRFFRIDNSQVNWYEVDFPNVMALKRKLLPTSDRYHLISSSILDPQWPQHISRSPGQPVLVILEGVSMYLTASENQALMQLIRDNFAPATMAFDLISTKMAQSSKRHDTVSKTTAEFKWGLDNPHDLEALHQGITIQETIYALKEFIKHPQRLPWWARLLRPVMAKLFAKSVALMIIQID